MKRLFFISALVLITLSACGAQTPPMAKFDQTAAPKSGEDIAVITTTKGVIKMNFFTQFAPETVKNFEELSKKKYYDGVLFHRVIPDFMIQGGDPTGTGRGGETYKGPGTTLPNEVVPDLTHIHGAVSMANKGDPTTGSSQFFIVQNKDGSHFLDGNYTIFGQVFEGLDVVDAIANAPRNSEDRPNKDIKMESVKIEKMP